MLLHYVLLLLLIYTKINFAPHSFSTYLQFGVPNFTPPVAVHIIRQRLPLMFYPPVDHNYQIIGSIEHGYLSGLPELAAALLSPNRF